MDDYVFDKPTEKDIHELADNLRPEDRKELIGMTGPDVLAEVKHCVESSDCCWVCRYKGIVMGMFGVICTNPFRKHGIVWMLASNETKKHKMFVGKWTKRGLKALLKDWEYLYNYIDEGNNETIAWLKWMGAKVYPAASRGIYGLKYHLFTFTRS